MEIKLASGQPENIVSGKRSSLPQLTQISMECTELKARLIVFIKRRRILINIYHFIYW